MENRRHADFGYFRDHADGRPAHTWAAMRDGHHDRFQDGRNRVFASTLDSVTGNPAHRQRFSALDRTHRDQFVAQNQKVRQFAQERRQSEAHGIISGNNLAQSARHAPLARSPISGHQADRLASVDAPPKRPEARGTNLRVNPAMLAKSPPATVRNHDVRDLAAGTVKRGATGGNAQVRSANPSPPVTARRDGRSGKTAGSLAGRETGVVQPIPQPRPTERLATVPKIGNLQRQAQLQPQVRQVPKPQFQPASPRTLTQPSPQARSVPRPQAQSMPQRLSTPQFQPASPRTFTQPSPQARSVPRPQAQSMPQRLSTPRFQPTSPRTFTPPQVRPQVRQAPQRQFQAPPQRMTQPQPQTRQMSLPQVRSSRQTPTQDSRGVRSSRYGR